MKRNGDNGGVILTSLILASAAAAALPQLPALPREMRAAWVATVDNIDWPTKRGDSTAEAKREMLAILDKAQALHLNTIVFQVRPSADALYESSLEPWSEYLTGRQGKAPSPMWDPLAFTVHEAHLRGIQVHAWFNPYRAMSNAQKGPNSDEHISKTHPEGVVKYGDQLWMDPGDPYIRKRTEQVILDVTERYNIDGVHMDDYFYPYPVHGKDGKDVPFPDDRSYDAYLKRGGKLDRGDWRRDNVNRMVEDVYHEIKAKKPWVLFGISPFGIYRPGVPKGISAGVDEYAQLYADPLKWAKEGWIDYLTPQLYWPISQKAQAFPTLLKWWGTLMPGRHYWPGLYTDRVKANGGLAVSEILNQMKLIRGTQPPMQTVFNGNKPKTGAETGATGEMHFSFTVLAQNRQNIDQALLAGPYRLEAATPPSPWLSRGRVPSLTLRRSLGSLEVTLPAENSLQLYGVTKLVKGHWTPWSLRGPGKIGLQRDAQYAFIGIDRYGRVTAPAYRKG